MMAAEVVPALTTAAPVTVAITASLGVAVASSTDLLEGVALHRADVACITPNAKAGTSTSASALSMNVCRV